MLHQETVLPKNAPAKDRDRKKSNGDNVEQWIRDGGDARVGESAEADCHRHRKQRHSGHEITVLNSVAEPKNDREKDRPNQNETARLSLGIGERLFRLSIKKEIRETKKPRQEKWKISQKVGAHAQRTGGETRLCSELIRPKTLENERPMFPKQ